MAARTRLDAELVRRGLARSRRHAGELIAAGRVSVDGAVVAKVSTQLEPDQDLDIATDSGAAPDYASRAGYKLAGALDALGAAGPGVHGRVCLDAGASTGGFTDVLLRRGAAHVFAVDVGHDQIVPTLRADPRVTVREGVNVRHLAVGDLDPAADLVVGDLSFISLVLVLPALLAVAAPRADLLLLVKPQFEVGRELLGAGGVVHDPAQRGAAVLAVARVARTLGLAVRAVLASSLPGANGNVEYFLWLDRVADLADLAASETDADSALVALVETAVAEGPSEPTTGWTSGGQR